MNKVIFALEGLAGSGKTTLLRALSMEGIKTIPEIMDHNSDTGRIKRFTINYCSSVSTNKWFMDIEIQRLDDAIRTTGSVALDRCFISQIAYNYAKDRTYGTKILPTLKDLLKQHNLIMPNLVYLRIETDQSISRMISRNKNQQKKYIEQGEPDYNYRFVDNNRLFYENIIPLLGENMLILDGDGKIANQIKQVEKWCKMQNELISGFNLDSLF